MDDLPTLPPLTADEAHEMLELVWTLRAESLDAPQVARLEELTCQRADGPDQYILAADLVANLFWCFRQVEPLRDEAAPVESAVADFELAALALPQTSDVAVTPPPITAAPARTPTLWARIARSRMATTLLVALVFYGTFTTISWNLRGGHHARHAARPVMDESPAGQVATITASEDAMWEVPEEAHAADPPSSILHSPSSITAAQALALTSGTVTLELKKGVQLVVQGPARWKIDGANRATLTHGKLIATVPHGAVGFTVKTPTAEIVDLGTEFGVTVDDEGDTKTHVFRGEIRVGQPRLKATTVAAGKSITLTAGQAVQVDRSGKTTFIQPLASTPAEFLRPSNAADEDNFNPNQLSAFAKYVIDETKPVAYWDFSRYQDSMKIVDDRMAGHPFEQFAPRHVGMLGPAASQGYAGLGSVNPAISFAGPQHYLKLGHASFDFPTTAYSLHCWLNLSVELRSKELHYPWGRGSTDTSRGTAVNDSLYVVGSLSLPGLKAGQLAFYGGRSDGVFDAANPRVGKTIVQPDRWYSLMFVRGGDRVQVYLDGQLEFDHVSPWAGGKGNVLTFGRRVDGSAPLNWSGLLDEIAIWDRALTASEVSALYRQAVGEPASSNVPESPITKP